jgi:hypothetical protein
MTPRKSEWMELAESDGSTRDVRKINKRLTFGTFAAVSAIIIGGALFANAHDEPLANAEVAVSSPTVSSPATTSTPSSAPAVKNPTPKASVSKIQVPAIASMPQGRDDDGEEHEGRGRGHDHGDHDDEEDDD